MAENLMLFWSFLLGLVVGSFLNVCIVRLPLGESVVLPRSRCRSCDRAIAWYDNIPLLSFLWLKGKCRLCHHPFSLRYPLVEALTGVASAATFYKFGFSLPAGFYFLFLVAPLLVITFIDLEHRIIPNVISLPGIVGGILTSWLVGAAGGTDRLLFPLIGLLVGGGSLFLVSWVYEKIRGQAGIGMGDVKLAAMLGAFFGWKGVFVVLLLASFLGSLVGLLLLLFFRKGMKDAVPFGPFLAAGALVYLYYGPELLAWYLNRIVSPPL